MTLSPIKPPEPKIDRKPIAFGTGTGATMKEKAKSVFAA
jgi:hypothetical protein